MRTCSVCRCPERVGSVVRRLTVQDTFEHRALRAAVNLAASPVQGCERTRCQARYRPPGRSSVPASCNLPHPPPTE